MSDILIMIGCFPLSALPEDETHNAEDIQKCNGCGEFMLAKKNLRDLHEGNPGAKMLCFHCIVKAKDILRKVGKNIEFLDIATLDKKH